MAPAAGNEVPEYVKVFRRSSRHWEGILGSRKTTATRNLLLQRTLPGVEKKRPANQPQFQSALELMGLLKVIWSSPVPLIRQLAKANLTQGKEKP